MLLALPLHLSSTVTETRYPVSGTPVTWRTTGTRRTWRRMMPIERVMGHRNKADTTLDVKPMYTMGEMFDADTGEMMKGHWCRLCKNAGVNSKTCFLLGNVTARQMHIKRNPDHFKIYKRPCEKNQVATHPWATPDHILKFVQVRTSSEPEPNPCEPNPS
ncbi:hypothetical protein MVEN_00080200 [Mycena venus]|uniref:Uncharacterized protein n=1 Tax=Mycena venus TaxID=2733690 RepID=A0A8H6Z746_9AGAR|nr:hypothetical protein MVEN_00080200 [Mycena venus]